MEESLLEREEWKKMEEGAYVVYIHIEVRLDDKCKNPNTNFSIIAEQG